MPINWYCAQEHDLTPIKRLFRGRNVVATGIKSSTSRWAYLMTTPPPLQRFDIRDESIDMPPC